ncbi:MAG: hypothetical protein Q8L15_18510 [Methylobacter sp.]|nr:hypothetical protein [Methylobacter sp.]
MTVASLYDLYLRQFDDKASGYFLTYETFLEFLKEAQDEACLRSNLIFDKISAFCTIPVISGTATYALNAAIYSIYYATITDVDGAVTAINQTDRIELDRLSADWRTRTEIPAGFIHDDTSIELVPKPNAAFTLNIEVYRLPVTVLTNITDVPEINKAYHCALVDYALYRAFSMPDNELYDLNKAKHFEEKFIRVFGHRSRATTRRAQYANRPLRNKACFI